MYEIVQWLVISYKTGTAVRSITVSGFYVCGMQMKQVMMLKDPWELLGGQKMKSILDVVRSSSVFFFFRLNIYSCNHVLDVMNLIISVVFC